MKGRDSGMPAEDYWATFFDAETVVARLLSGMSPRGSIVEFGCGYGTFTFPAARQTTGNVTALDIEPEMIAKVQLKAVAARAINVRAELRDFVSDGTGLTTASQSHAMIYNILHLESPLQLLLEARRVLHKDGILSVMHWRSDIPTPRGPPLAIRPTPEQCESWLKDAGFGSVRRIDIADCCRYHFSLVAARSR